MFYIFHGDDALSQKEFLSEKLFDRFGDPAMLELNTTRLGSSVAMRELRQACQTAPFLASVRVVIVQDLLSSKPPKALLEELAAFLPELPPTARLIFLESAVLPDNHSLIKLARTQETGFEKSFAQPQGVGLTQWVRNRAVSKGGQIAPAAAQMLAGSVSGKLNPSGEREKREEAKYILEALDIELEKLVLYRAGQEDSEIKREDVALLSPYVAEESIFDMVDALGNRNEKRASYLYQKKLAEGEDPFRLFPMIVRQFRLLIQAKELAEAGKRPSDMARPLGVPGFVATKLAQQARGFSMTELEHIYEHLLAIDVAAKTGEAEMQTSLDLLIANLTMAP